MFDVNISIDGNRVSGKFVADSYFFESSKYYYAFYLYNGSEKIDTVWYSKNMEVFFDLKDVIGDICIQAFVKDIEHGNIRSYFSKKLESI